MLNELGYVFGFASAIGALMGYISAWIMVVQGAKTRYFQDLTDQCASSGMTRNQSGCFVGLKLGFSFGLLACIADGLTWLVR